MGPQNIIFEKINMGIKKAEFYAEYKTVGTTC
jgi:hypothetical protein